VRTFLTNSGSNGDAGPAQFLHRYKCLGDMRIGRDDVGAQVQRKVLGSQDVRRHLGEICVYIALNICVKDEEERRGTVGDVLHWGGGSEMGFKWYAFTHSSL